MTDIILDAIKAELERQIARSRLLLKAGIVGVVLGIALALTIIVLDNPL
jgi:hypothetical protein